MSQTKALYRLQTIDLDLDARRTRLREIKQLLGDDDELRQAQANVAAIEGKLKPEQARVKDLNHEIETVNTQSMQFSDRLYGGTVSNPKELQDIQDKIAALKRRHADLENQLLETMIAVEELQEALATAHTHLSEVEQTRADEHAGLRSEGRELQQAIKALKTDREEAVQRLDDDTLAFYQDAQPKRLGRVVSPLEGEVCSVCGVGQTTTTVQRVRQGQDMITCSNCGRILIAL